MFHFSTRQITLLGLFATLWAVIEIQLGLIFRSIHLPFFGAILTFAGFVILLISRDVVRKKGTIILVTLTTAFLKLIYLGVLSLLPVLAIISEGILLEMIFWRVTQPNKFHFIFSGCILFAWTFVYPFFALGLLAGWEISRILQLITGWGHLILGISPEQAKLILVIVLGLHLVTGVVAGIVGFNFITFLHNRIKQRTLFGL